MPRRAPGAPAERATRGKENRNESENCDRFGRRPVRRDASAPASCRNRGPTVLQHEWLHKLSHRRCRERRRPLRDLRLHSPPPLRSTLPVAHRPDSRRTCTCDPWDRPDHGICTPGPPGVPDRPKSGHSVEPPAQGRRTCTPGVNPGERRPLSRASGLRGPRSFERCQLGIEVQQRPMLASSRCFVVEPEDGLVGGLHDPF